jgi:hypothetical protein
MTLPTSEAILRQAIKALAEHGTQHAAAHALGLSRNTLASRLLEARRRGFAGEGVEDKDNPEILRSRIRQLELLVAAEQKKTLTHTLIKQAIVGLAEDLSTTATPSWVIDPRGARTSPGVPTLFCSDLHWGEVVDPKQINGVNTYNLAIARKRLDYMAERAVRLTKVIDPGMGYPGLVLILGGDMISGNIHDELTATNEVNSMPAVLDLYGRLVGMVDTLAGIYGKMLVPCVTGNHGRDTRKIWGKDRHHTSFDWLLYCFLAKHFEKDKRVDFVIPEGSDASFQIYHHRYLLTHGDQFRGGDGMIGALGPIMRGDHKKRSRNAQIDMDYDTLLMGHFHQYIHLNKLIVNGSLKGYDEYAYANNFGFEPPQQALWLTHPKYRVTFRAPVYVDKGEAGAAPPTFQWRT